MHCYTKCAGNMILKSGHFCFSWIDNTISCGKGIELDDEGRLHQESLGCEDRVRQTDEHTCICSMVHLLKTLCVMFTMSTTSIYYHFMSSSQTYRPKLGVGNALT